MGFLRRLLGTPRSAGTAAPTLAAPSAASTPITSLPTTVTPTRAHPNAALAGPLPASGLPERWRFEVPDGIAVLNAKTRNGLHAVRLNRTDPEVLGVVAGPGGRELVQTDLRTDSDGVAVFLGDTCLGRLPARVAERFGPLVRDYEARGWRLVTWTDVIPPADSIAEGGSRSGPALVAEARLPDEHEPLFADVYDASFAFPTQKVLARRGTPEGKAEHEVWLASVPPARETVVVRVGSLVVRASRCPWEAFGDQALESRGLRLKDEHSIWLTPGEVGRDLGQLGARIVEVAGITHHPDHDAPAFAAEQQVRLVPEPGNRYDRNAIAVRSADGRLMAGYLPREVAAWCHRRGGAFSGLVVWEYRHAGQAGRVGLRLLIAPAPITVEPA